MSQLKKFPYFEVEFDKNGKSAKAAQVKALRDFLAKGSTTDLFVISHGWNNDMAEALKLYTGIFGCVRTVLDSKDGKNISKRKFAIMGVFWPSHKFADKELIPSGAAGFDSPFTNDFLKQELEEMKAVFNTKKGRATLDKAKLLVPKLEDSKKARTEFADLLRSLLPKQASPDVDAAGDFSKLPGDELLQRLSKPVPVTLSKPKTGGGAARLRGGAAGIGDFFSGIKSSAAHMLNLVTYYQMKERAGIVGSTGVNDILRFIRAQNPKIKLHLVGHSFGGRLVVSAVAGTDEHPSVKVDSLTLLQAAFSHYGFAQNYEGSNNGFFRKVISDKLVLGPTLISCTDNDKAVGLAYPLASLLAGQVAAGLGDKDNKYGGIGRNGAQKTPEAVNGTLLKVGDVYDFKAGKVYNLNSDTIITGHSDLEHNEVAYALLTAVSTT